jgi:hypothetical protein
MLKRSILSVCFLLTGCGSEQDVGGDAMVTDHPDASASETSADAIGASDGPPDAPTGKTIDAASPDRADVAAAIAMASPGDTVRVPAGSAKWTSTLTIHTGINLVGAGIGKTVISGTVQLISYAPSPGNFALDLPFRVSGFTFELLGSGKAIGLDCACHLPAQTRIRIDHNAFDDSSAPGAGVENTSCFGVVDHNAFTKLSSPLRAWGDSCPGYMPSTFGRWSWESFGEYVYGTSKVLVFEDNTFQLNASHYMVSDGDQGCSYVVRYNTIDTGGGIYPAFDLHGGGQRGNLWGCRGGEIYGNAITGSGFLVSQRGGRASVHHNTFTAGGTVNIYDNDGSPIQGVSPYDVLQRINLSYHFANRRSETGTLLGFSSSGGDDNKMVIAGSTYWMDGAIGCGSAVPATCATGDAFWETTQSCSSLAGMIGTAPASPIAGTLHRCASPNTWSVQEALLAYPHPLVTP